MPRLSRPSPRELCVDWPRVASGDPIGEVARQFTVRLRDAIGGRPLRAVAELTGLDHSTIVRILDGQVWPDLYTIARLERGLGADLWPGRPE